MASPDNLARTLLAVIFIFPVTKVHFVISECPPGKYGVDCRYGCHCEFGITCDPTSGCNPTICASGWSGSTCQKENVALYRPSVQSSTWALQGKLYPAQYAVDGRVGHKFDITPCTHTDSNNQPSYWRVTLSQVYEIFGFTIYNRGEAFGYRLNNFTLSVGNTSTGIYTTCYQDQTTSSGGPGLIITRNCQNEMTILGNSVKISLNPRQYLTLCEVEVFACSSGTWGSDCGQYCHCWNDVPCSVKTGACPVSDRAPICKTGYNGAQCNTVCQAGQYGPDCSELCGNCAEGRTSCDERTGECPLIPDGTRCLAGYRGTECKTVCSSGTWGSDCGQYCHCWNDVACSVQTGACPVKGVGPICKAGYNGTQCNTVCQDGQYGPDCSEFCGNCAEARTSCDKRTGECPLIAGDTRCLGGYRGTECKTVCQDGQYGPDCSELCGNCAEGSTSCDKRTGECPLTADGTRCLANYGDTVCKRVCSHGSWGVNCTETCGRCWNNSACHKETGKCPKTLGNPLCSVGFLGERCNERCSRGKWGENCKLTCSVNCKLGPTGCDVTSGECFEGCQEGYSGKYCGNSIQVDYTSTIVGSVVGVSVAAFVLALLIFFLKRHRRRPPNHAQTDDHSSGPQERSVQYIAKHDEDNNHQIETHSYEEMPEENTYERVLDRNYVNVSNSNQESAYTHLT